MTHTHCWTSPCIQFYKCHHLFDINKKLQQKDDSSQPVHQQSLFDYTYSHARGQHIQEDLSFVVTNGWILLVMSKSIFSSTLKNTTSRIYFIFTNIYIFWRIRSTVFVLPSYCSTSWATETRKETSLKMLL